ncbi:COP9/Signalosome and eIF3 complex-shared subunit 1 [Aphelenchoides avenae]|nr:COP9/Signalosome and eIF3 complex-shared subunit 1 [Aphelenchus avenae]
MASAKVLVFATADEKTQVSQLRKYYSDKGVKIPTEGPQELFENTVQLIEASGFLGSLNVEKEVEMVLNALFSLIITFPDAQAAVLTDKLYTLLTSGSFQGHGWQSMAGAAVRVLSNFFHTYNDRPSLQASTYKNLLKMCGKAKLTKFIPTDLKEVDALTKTWNLAVEDKREILRILHTVLIEDDRADAAADVMTALLRTYTDEDAAHAQDDARECVRTAIIDPKSFSFDHLLRLSAVKHLKKTDPLIHKTLELFTGGRLEDYRKFVAQNPSFVKDKLQVDEETLEKKIRILTLISLAEEKQVLPLAELAKALDIADEWVLEEFIIDAIRINAINGKINEPKKELVVTTFQRRAFDRPQWELLQKRLITLLDHLKESHKNVHSIVPSGEN